MIERNLVELEIKAKHFRPANYKSCKDCAIAMAARDLYKTDDVSEGVHEVCINGIRYKHSEYDRLTYEKDFDIAMASGFKEEVVRIINLIPV